MCTTHAQTSKGERNLERDYDAPTLAQLEEPPTRRCPICGGAAVLGEGDADERSAHGEGGAQ